MINNVQSANFTVPNSGVAGSYGEIDELQSYFGRVNYSIGNKYILTGTLRADGSSKFGENNRYGYFPSAAVAWRLSNEDFIGDAFYDLKLRMGWGVTGNQEFPGGSHLNLRRFQNPNGILTAPRFANPDLKWEISADLISRSNFNWTPTLNVAFNGNKIENMEDSLETLILMSSSWDKEAITSTTIMVMHSSTRQHWKQVV